MVHGICYSTVVDMLHMLVCAQQVHGTYCRKHFGVDASKGEKKGMDEPVTDCT